MDWHAWRRQGIGASDAPIIMGVSPYSTPHKLWLVKTGRDKSSQSNWATRRGQEMEPAARAYYELMTGVDMPPTLLEHYEFPWLRASMDGWNNEHKIGLEIKCPGAKNHALALAGKVPDEYYPQLQHQLFVSGADYIDYFSFDGTKGVTVRVIADLEYILSYVSKARAFWDLVEQDQPPELINRDYKTIRSKDFRILLEEWESASLSDPEKADYLSSLIFQHDDVANRRVRNTRFKIDGIKRRIIIDEF